MKNKSIKLNAFLNTVRSLMTVIFPLITFPYVSRVLSVDGIGKYNFSSSVVSYFLLIAGLGINTYAIREGAKYRDNKKVMAHFIDEIFTINICSSLVAYLLLFLCLIFSKKLQPYSICILVYSVQIAFSVIGVEWLFTVYEDFMYITIRSIAFQIISLLLLLLFVREPSDYLNYAAITVFSSVGSNFLNFLKAKKQYQFKIVKRFNWKKHMKPILILFASNIASLIYINSDITILGLMKNDYIVGIYSVSSRIYSIIKVVLSSILLVTIPRLAMLYGNKKLNEYKNLLEKVSSFLIILILPAMVGLIMLSKEVVLIIAGNHFLRSTASLRILAIAYIFAILAWVLSECVLIPAKREKFLLRSTVVSAVLNVIFNVIFIPYFAEGAAAISTVLSELTMFIMNYYYSRDIVNDVFLSKNMLITFFDSIVGCIGVVAICFFMLIIYKSIVTVTIVSVISSLLIYFVIQLILRNVYAVSITRQLINILKKHY